MVDDSRMRRMEVKSRMNMERAAVAKHVKYHLVGNIWSHYREDGERQGFPLSM